MVPPRGQGLLLMTGVITLAFPSDHHTFGRDRLSAWARGAGSRNPTSRQRLRVSRLKASKHQPPGLGAKGGWFCLHVVPFGGSFPSMK